MEVVQKFYEILQEPMRKATKEVKDLHLLCPPGKFTLNYQAVISLVYEDSKTNEKSYHAARVSISLCKFYLIKSGYPSYSYTKRIKPGIEEVDTDCY